MLNLSGKISFTSVIYSYASGDKVWYVLSPWMISDADAEVSNCSDKHISVLVISLKNWTFEFWDRWNIQQINNWTLKTKPCKPKANIYLLWHPYSRFRTKGNDSDKLSRLTSINVKRVCPSLFVESRMECVT